MASPPRLRANKRELMRRGGLGSPPALRYLAPSNAPPRKTLQEFAKETQWLKRAISPLCHKAETEGASGDLQGCCKLPAPEPDCEACSCVQLHPVRVSVWAYFTECA
eukprot:1140083-Pelagomonas_calceolata.AAC.1